MPPPSVDVVAALVRRADRLLLVAQQGPDDERPNWMLPGGRIDPRERPEDAVRREVREETGLEVTVRGVAFRAEHHAADAHWNSTTFDCVADDDALCPDDPDGFVLRADWIPIADALDRLARVPWYDPRPLVDYLATAAHDRS